MLLVESPCHNCPDRAVGCHSRCDKWTEYRERAEAEKRKYSKYKADEADVVSFVVDNTRKRRKEWNKNKK